MREPMLAISSTGASGRNPIDLEQLMSTGDWIADTKLDGIRAYLLPNGRILNRRGTDITRKFPEITNPTSHWLDGEIVAVRGNFEATLLREAQETAARITRAAEETPCRFVAFDLPDYHDEPWERRRRRLISDVEPKVPITPVGGLDLWESTRDLGMEGVIAKRLNAHYQFGKRSRDWVKFKHLFRVSCLVAGYDTGTGSRAHFGAMLLALLDDGEPVQVGRVGSGFTERQTHELKARIDAGELLVAEIETVNVTSGHTLRFPVFRGIRTDVDPHTCTIDQLAAIPRS